MNKPQKAGVPFHPLLIGIYPVLALFLFNIEETPLFAITRSLIFSLITVFIVYMFFLFTFTRWNTVVHSKKNSTLFGLAILFGIFYPFIYNLLKDSSIASMPIGKHRFLLPAWGIFFLVIFLSLIGIKGIPKYLSDIFAWEKASLATSLFLLLFFMYGHIFNQFLYDPSKGNKYLFVQYQNLIYISIGIFIAGLTFIVFSKSPQILNRWLNIVSTILVGMLVIQLGFYFISHLSNATDTTHIATSLGNIHTTSTDNRDVYYILIDAYSREDVLKSDLNLDTSGFINELKNMGFVVPSCSNSNYPVTDMSMSATLNMDYLENLDIPKTKKECLLEGCLVPSDLSPFIKHSLVRKKFEELGYSTVTFKVVNPYLDISDSTYYYDFSKNTGSINKTETVFFYYLFLKTTALRPYLDYLDWQSILHPNSPAIPHEWLPVGSAFADRNYNQYKLTLFNLDHLVKIPDLPGKKFVYAHLIITHEPFVFTPDGQFRYPVTGDPQAYDDQVQFADNRMIMILRTIIEKSKTPPIIILQGDHGWPWGPVRTHNLSAFYLPNNGGNLVYPEITNVNTFRIIFNKYFGGRYQLLPDITYPSISKSNSGTPGISSSCSN